MTDAGSTALRQFSFTTRPFLAVDYATGESIGLDDIDIRVGWMLELIHAAQAEFVSRLWQPATFDALEADRDRQGRIGAGPTTTEAWASSWHDCKPKANCCTAKQRA